MVVDLCVHRGASTICKLYAAPPVKMDVSTTFLFFASYAATADLSFSLVAKMISITSSTTLSGVDAPEVTPITTLPAGSQS